MGCGLLIEVRIGVMDWFELVVSAAQGRGREIPRKTTEVDYPYNDVPKHIDTMYDVSGWCGNRLGRRGCRSTSMSIADGIGEDNRLFQFLKTTSNPQTHVIGWNQCPYNGGVVIAGCEQLPQWMTGKEVGGTCDETMVPPLSS
jgi:hypothetical protein